MDEADKYKQRLEAIAEKRRLQEEQDKARREMEDEKLRLQQLKRKSLRDQWLMEGAPLSPKSQETQSPHSPLWGTQAQEMEKHIDKLQSENQRLAEEQEKLEEQTEDSQTKAVKVTEAAAEMTVDVLQNGENNATSETTDDEVKLNQIPLLDETAVILTNGGGDMEANHKAAEQNNPLPTNGPIGATEDVISMKLEPGFVVSVEGCGQVPNVNITEEEEDEEEEGTLVMRAECVIITDDGDDLPEELLSQEDQQESMKPDKTTQPNPETGKDGGDAVEEEVKPETAPERFTEPEKSEATELTTEAQPESGDADEQGSIKANGNRDGETEAEGQDIQLDETPSVHLQSQANALEGTTVALVPVYSEVQPSPVSLEVEAESEVPAAPEGAEAKLKAQDPACLPGQFQDVPLADPKENHRTEAGPGEQEPLLLKDKVPNTKAEPAGANGPASPETQSPTRAGQGAESEPPKQKTCQCCSVM
ncbi:paralemmin-3 isoform X1 [Embiotoca jacksoni]|uniref:paralemmin-3 isoform X1 n=1 Tax=Embiotoca jacksoni TaxID=100190 RepID=UPI0037036EAD